LDIIKALNKNSVEGLIRGRFASQKEKQIIDKDISNSTWKKFNPKNRFSNHQPFHLDGDSFSDTGPI